MRKKQHFLILISFVNASIFCLIQIKNVRGEEVTLQSGKIITGEIVETTDSYVKIKTETGTLKIRYRLMDDQTAKKFGQLDEEKQAQREVLRSYFEQIDAIPETSVDLGSDAVKDAEADTGNSVSSGSDQPPITLQEGCDELLTKFSACQPFLCRQPHPTAENLSVVHEIFGYENGLCHYQQVSPAGYTMECLLPSVMVEQLSKTGLEIKAGYNPWQDPFEKGFCKGK